MNKFICFDNVLQFHLLLSKHRRSTPLILRTAMVYRTPHDLETATLSFDVEITGSQGGAFTVSTTLAPPTEFVSMTIVRCFDQQYCRQDD